MVKCLNMIHLFPQQVTPLKDNHSELPEPSLPELIGETEILDQERRRCVSIVTKNVEPLPASIAECFDVFSAY